MALQVERRLERIQSHKGVLGSAVINPEGKVLRTSMDTTTTNQYANMCKNLASMARGTVRDVDPADDLLILRVRTKEHEVIIAPERTGDGTFFIVALQSIRNVAPEGSIALL
ncbi:predicted protein [Nematostella vectensis]|uniref:Dynein light chain roadblock n=1 Tax=Nematostella vectensis TaxID=45351 RepID=A7S4N8_NEMVE|nr:predicted protein [Nematostella vectensis]|eukprot:XP_001633419.1 predicted protein [Nematostella vectensis]